MRAIAPLLLVALSACTTSFDESLLADSRPPDTLVVDIASDAALDAAMDVADGPAVDADAALEGGGLDGPLPDAGPLTLTANGKACTSDAQCLSGHCADGYCCNLPCTAPCSSCKLTGKLGVCSFVAAGSSPPSGTGKSCSSSSKSTCGNDGKCDGRGSCRKWIGGTICKSVTCTSDGSGANPAKHCDGAGACAYLVSNTPTSCVPFACDSGTGCHGSCTTVAECTAPSTCSNSKCVGGKLPLGTDCTSGSQCESTLCVEGVCCESACTDTCKTCSLPGVLGHCVDVPDGAQPPSGKSCATSPPCGEDGRCNGKGACRVTPTGTVCKDPVCFDGPSSSVLRESFCDAATKTCKVTESPCGAYACQSGAPSCHGRCTADSHCRAPAVCVGGYCN